VDTPLIKVDHERETEGKKAFSKADLERNENKLIIPQKKTEKKFTQKIFFLFELRRRW